MWGRGDGRQESLRALNYVGLTFRLRCFTSWVSHEIGSPQMTTYNIKLKYKCLFIKDMNEGKGLMIFE